MRSLSISNSARVIVKLCGVTQRAHLLLFLCAVRDVDVHRHYVRVRLFILWALHVVVLHDRRFERGKLRFILFNVLNGKYRETTTCVSSMSQSYIHIQLTGQLQLFCKQALYALSAKLPSFDIFLQNICHSLDLFCTQIKTDPCDVFYGNNE